MKVNSKHYKQYLINTQVNYTCDYMAQFGDMSGDSIERFLKESRLKPSFIWEQIKDEIVYSPQGCLIIDKTVLEHKNSNKIQGAHKQWSGSSHDIVMGVGLVNLVYYNPDINRFWILDCKVWDKDVDGKTETEIAHDLLKIAVNRGIEFSTVMFDSFYASSVFLTYIALDLKKIFYTSLPKGRVCKELDKTDGYIAIKDLEWSDEELQTGKLVRIRETPEKLKVKLFSIASSERRIDALCTNYIEDTMTARDIQEVYAYRWKVEEFHQQIKGTLGIAKCQCRKRRSQKNHIICSILAYTYLTKEAIKANTTIFQLKRRQLDDYMLQIMKHPHWEYLGV
jgi:SRSO17 transposase